MIKVEHRGRNEYEVTVETGGSASTHAVTLSDEYHEKLSGGSNGKPSETKEDLIRRSFEFLLERESKESILGSFDLPLIGRYFPEYEREIAAQ
jgi:hypothetical protein